MKTKPLHLFLFVFVSGAFQTAYPYLFTDDFNDGNLEGWIEKQGNWTNPGNYLLSSYDQYGVIWKADSFGFTQYLEIEAFFEPGSYTKTAQLILRGGVSQWGFNRYYDHAYRLQIQENDLNVFNTTAPGQHHHLGNLDDLDLPMSQWTKIGFGVSGLGSETRLQVWINDELRLDVFDTTGLSHDDGGYLGLGSSNHINRYMKYDNAHGRVDEPIIPETRKIGSLGMFLLGLYLGCRIPFVRQILH